MIESFVNEIECINSQIKYLKCLEQLNVVQEEKMKLRIFTDGACSGNPGPGGWAALFALPTGNKIISGCEEETTNNKMELLAVAKALTEVIDGEWDSDKRIIDDYNEIEIHSDSAYVVNAINKNWLSAWSMNGWKTTRGEQVKNGELWFAVKEYLVQAKCEGIVISFVKVKGHSGNLFNEMVDKRARLESLRAKKEK